MFRSTRFHCGTPKRSVPVDFSPFISIPGPLSPHFATCPSAFSFARPKFAAAAEHEATRDIVSFSSLFYSGLSGLFFYVSLVHLLIEIRLLLLLPVVSLPAFCGQPPTKVWRDTVDRPALTSRGKLTVDYNERTETLIMKSSCGAIYGNYWVVTRGSEGSRKDCSELLYELLIGQVD